MFKKTIIAAVAVAALAGIAAPAFASTSPFGDGNDEAREFAADTMLIRLQDKGVDAVSIEEWGGLVRAFVKTDNGHQVMKFYTPDTLEQVSI